MAAMTPEEALKRIEERHSVDGQHCVDDEGLPPIPCNVVKLARALVRLMGPRPDTSTHPHSLNPDAEGWAQAERTLREVAGREK